MLSKRKRITIGTLDSSLNMEVIQLQNIKKHKINADTTFSQSLQFVRVS